MIKYTIKTTHIDYDINEEDVDYDVFDVEANDIDEAVDLAIEEIRSNLPQELTFEIECEPDDLDDEIVDAVTNETGWLINQVDYVVISQKAI